MPDLSGKTLGQYQIIKSIGQGGMARIYLAYQPSIKRDVAIKVLSPALQDDPGFIEHFAQEADVIAHLQHPYIIPVYDFGQHEDQFYIVMAYLRGGTLADRIEAAPNGLPDDETMRLFDHIAEGLDYAHAKEILHRDLKPSNILMDEQNNPYIADFGLAKPTEGKLELTNTMMTGTATYMAPEIAREGKSTARADIYALGVMLFEMLTGKLPYDGETPYKILSAHVQQPIPDIRQFRPDLPDGVQAVIERALAKEPEDRFATASEMASALKTELTNRIKTQAHRATATRTVTTRPREFPHWLFWGVGMVVLLIAGLSFARFEFLHKTTGTATGILDPTVHIAQAFKSPTGETQWTFGCLSNGSEALVDLDCKQIRIAVQNRQLPYNYILSATNQPGGMDYDMWWDICSRLHCQPVFIEEKWETTLGKIASGAYDAAAEGITITDKRKQVVAFSNSYMNVNQKLVVRKGESRFANINAFVANDQLVAGALENSTNFDIAKQFIPENRIRTYKEYSTIFYALTTGDIDAAIADQAEGQTTIIGIDFQQAVNLEFIGDSLSSDQFGIVFQKNSGLVEPVNQALQDMRAQGTLEELITRYFGPSFGVTYQDIGLGAYAQ